MKEEFRPNQVVPQLKSGLGFLVILLLVMLVGVLMLNQKVGIEGFVIVIVIMIGYYLANTKDDKDISEQFVEITDDHINIDGEIIEWSSITNARRMMNRVSLSEDGVRITYAADGGEQRVFIDKLKYLDSYEPIKELILKYVKVMD